MNLLIAVLGNTFDKVMNQIDVVHFRTKVEILDEVQDLMIWNRDKNEEVYLYFVNYAGLSLSPNREEGDEWEGRVKTMQKKLGEVENICRDIIDENETYS